MEYLKRKIDKYLTEWKKSVDKKPLIIKGARQVGKTESIKKFGKENYDNVIEINFVEKPIYKNIISNGYDVD
ncbi:MAG: AAA family ATPase, partial [Bacilli bacterium]